MATLDTISEINDELAATADYDVTIDTDKAKRHIVALRRKLHFASSASREGQMAAFDLARIESELQNALAWYRANATLTEAQLQADPSVLHADFSGFHRYSRYAGACS